MVNKEWEYKEKLIYINCLATLIIKILDSILKNLFFYPSPQVVSTLLEAKWSSTPFVLESAEFLGDESGNEAFWEAVEFLAEEEDNLGKISDKDLYERVLSFSSRSGIVIVFIHF